MDQVARLTNRPSLRAERTEKRGLPGGRAPPGPPFPSLPPLRGEGKKTPCPPDEEEPNLRARRKAWSLAQYLADLSFAAAAAAARQRSTVAEVNAQVVGR